jgi:hypothetical protein
MTDEEAKTWREQLFRDVTEYRDRHADWIAKGERCVELEKENEKLKRLLADVFDNGDIPVGIGRRIATALGRPSRE